VTLTALTIAGSDSGGGAGIQADLKTFSALGVHGLTVVTSLTAQNTSGVREIHDPPKEFLEAQFDALHEDFPIRAAKTGMLSKEGIIETVARKVGDYPLVVDPVMVAQSGDSLLEEGAVRTLQRRLFPRALLLTPNLLEAEALTGLTIRNEDGMKRAAEILSDHVPNVLVKGGHLHGTDVLSLEGRVYVLEGEFLRGPAHGSGCTLAAAIAAHLALGFDLLTSVRRSKAFVSRGIASAYLPGKGSRVVNPLAEDWKAGVFYRLHRVVAALVENPALPQLIPEVGMNLTYALPGARDVGEVAAIAGRIVRVGDRAGTAGGVAFGGSSHMARVTLAAMGFDPGVRSALNLRFSEEILEACRRCFVLSEFDRREEPEGERGTMEWGTERAIAKLERVPDAVFDRGGMGKEPMIRLLGRDPEEVREKVLRLLGELSSSPSRGRGGP
jgi:hydroxymethylpyrimidine/phosphomethylpyrimidine kinase